MATPRDHIDEIRKTKFSIGGAVNPLTEDLHQAVRNLSAELYAKDAHFLMELIQNAEDNEYLEGVKPTLEFIVTDKDITKTGAESTLLIFNNEKGFSTKNIESICSVGRSTKKGKRKEGYIGEKGIGFKSVFLITSQPYIFSNGYKIRFNEKPVQECSVGYIVPEWVEECPTVSQIHEIYGINLSLPTTVFVLPLKHDKVKAVKEQLSNMHPEILLFLSKIRKLSVGEQNNNPKLNSVSAISIDSETNFVSRKNIDAESCNVHLSAEQSSNTQECSYYMWKQKFPVKTENKVDVRMEVEEWVITLAFPFDQRLNRGLGTPGVYAFLPTEMVTNLPFIIQADFLLTSSRETILFNNNWNKGILDCVPLAFVNALNTLVKSSESAPRSSLTNLFKFVPLENTPYQELENVRESIRQKLMLESIIPCESYTEQNIFGKPSDVARLVSAFWNILHDARDQGVNLSNISSHGNYIVHHSFAKKEYCQILDFLGVKLVNADWYAKCIQSIIKSADPAEATEEMKRRAAVFAVYFWRCGESD